MRAGKKDIITDIRTFFKGELRDDDAALAKASRDASIFEVRPRLVARPKNAEDLKRLVRWAVAAKKKDKGISLTARSGGTDMTGGPLTRSIVVDMNAHLNKFLGLTEKKGKSAKGLPTEGEARVQPGMFYRKFEKRTLAHRLIMPSYPASREICTVGGMVSNNSGGEKTLLYGKTEDYIAELKMVLADGDEHVFRPLGRAELGKKLKEKSLEGDIYRKVHRLIERNYRIIMAARPDVSKNSAGYYLWNVWDKEKKVFDLTRLLVGSQGTLGFVTEITFKLVRPNPHSLMAVIFLRDMGMIAEITNALLKFKPESLECYDDKTLKLAIRFFPAILARVKTGWLKFLWSFLPDLEMLVREHGMPKLVILAELTGESEKEIRPRLQSLEKAMRKFGVVMHLTGHEPEEKKYWTIRRESFNLLRQHVHGQHTLPVVDDVIVQPRHLPKFLPELQAILAKYKDKMTATLAGHNGDGNFHVIPLMDFKDPKARAMVPKVMDEVYALVLKYKGSITAEHNDGLIRTPYLQKMYGRKVTGLFKEVKRIFDPQGVFNPGKKVGGNLQASLKWMIRE